MRGTEDRSQGSVRGDDDGYAYTEAAREIRSRDMSASCVACLSVSAPFDQSFGKTVSKSRHPNGGLGSSGERRESVRQAFMKAEEWTRHNG